jgi:hypothetical protein
LLTIPVWWLIFFIIKHALVRSKNPEWFGVYSNEKILLIIGCIFFALITFVLIRRVKFSDRLLCKLALLSKNKNSVFFAVAILSSLPFLNQGVEIGEDIGKQVKSTVQWNQGLVPYPNFVLGPNNENLSINELNWQIRSPGPSLLGIPGMLWGLSLGNSIKLGLFLCSLGGGLGWLRFFKECGVSDPILLLVAIMLGLEAGTSITNFSSANIMLYAIVPWFLCLVWKLSNYWSEQNRKFKKYIITMLLLIALGFFSWIKTSGIIVAGTIGAFLFLHLLITQFKKTPFRFSTIFAIMGLLFWVPFLILEGNNRSLLGFSAEEFYGSLDSELETPLTGKYWKESTTGFWLGWSFLGSPGYALPSKDLANRSKSFGLQFETFRKWTNESGFNEHVFLAGIVGLIFSVFLFISIFYAFTFINIQTKILIYCFYILPFVGLAILSFRYSWNYLLYHSHTSEFWVILILPLLILLSNDKVITISTRFLMGFCLALPISYNLEELLVKIGQKEDSFISQTESQTGLSSSRFSKAIESIEKDSNNPLDVLFFLPAGDMSDLILRTKMRTLATHFSGDNFPAMNEFKTIKALNVYCAYDSSLASNKKFIDSFDSKFPQKMFQEIIHSEKITVLKITLTPGSSNEQRS